MEKSGMTEEQMEHACNVNVSTVKLPVSARCAQKIVLIQSTFRDVAALVAVSWVNPIMASVLVSESNSTKEFDAPSYKVSANTMTIDDPITTLHMKQNQANIYASVPVMQNLCSPSYRVIDFAKIPIKLRCLSTNLIVNVMFNRYYYLLILKRQKPLLPPHGKSLHYRRLNHPPRSHHGYSKHSVKDLWGRREAIRLKCKYQ